MQILSRTDRANEVNKTLLYGFWSIFLSVYSVVFVFRNVKDVAVYLWAWFRFTFTIVRHSFVLQINSFQEKRHWCSRTCYCSNVSIKTYLIVFYFHLNQLRNFPAKKYRSGILPSHNARECNTLFFSQWASCTTRKQCNWLCFS